MLSTATLAVSGGMAEWTNARLLKSREAQASVGSNPTPSAGQRFFLSNGPKTKFVLGEFNRSVRRNRRVGDRGRQSGSRESAGAGQGRAEGVFG